MYRYATLLITILPPILFLRFLTSINFVWEKMAVPQCLGANPRGLLTIKPYPRAYCQFVNRKSVSM